jgi:hypothetical protein
VVVQSKQIGQPSVLLFLEGASPHGHGSHVC